MADEQDKITLVAGTHPTIGEVIWIWGHEIDLNEGQRGHRVFWITFNGGMRSMVHADEVPLSVHHKEWTGLMMPKVLAELNGFALDRW